MKLTYKITTVVIFLLLCTLYAFSAGWFDTVKRLNCDLDLGIVYRVQLEFNLTKKKVNIWGPGYGFTRDDGIVNYDVLDINESKDTITFGDAEEKFGSIYQVDRKTLRLKNTSNIDKSITYGHCEFVDKFEVKMIPRDKRQL